MRDKSITPYNNKGQRHGLWKTYNYNGNLRFYHNGKRVGYEEWYDYTTDGKLFEKKYHI